MGGGACGEGQCIGGDIFGCAHVLAETLDQGANAGDMVRLMMEKVSRKRGLTEDIRAQSVLEFRKEACGRELHHCMDVRQFRLDVMEDAKNIGVGGTEDVGDIGWGANREAQDCHAVNSLGT